MREHAQRLLDRISPRRLEAVVHFLETMLDEDSEFLTPAEAAKIGEAQEWLKRNEPIPNSVVLAEFGLTEADFELMAREP